MHNMVKKSLCFCLLISSWTIFSVAPYYSIRSQSENAARELVGAGWNTQINLCDMEEWYGNFSVTPEYTKSFRPYKTAQCLFGCYSSTGTCCWPSSTSSCSPGCYPCGTSCGYPCGTSCGSCCNTSCDTDCYRIVVSGSQVSGRGSCDWLADYFGLPTDYYSCVTFEPRIDNFLVDFNFYLGMDEWCDGMYFRIHAPVVHTRWALNMCECVNDSGSNNHWVGYFNSAQNSVGSGTYGILNNNLINSFTSFITGCGVINASDITFNPLCYAKMDCCRRTKTALSDVQMALGWNFWRGEDYHVGLNIRSAAPTGNRPEGCYLFEPIVGNGKHWELGGGFTSHWTFWRNEEETRSGAFFLDINVTHLFKSKECRTFDLFNKPLSRYMLAAKFGVPVQNLYVVSSGNYVRPTKQFLGVYSPVANLTTIPVDVTVSAQADAAFMFQYLHNNWGLDLGYNFWGRCCEKIECRCDCCPCFEENTWALKGDAFMYGYNDSEGTTVPVALSATQSQATLFGGRNNWPNGDTVNNINWYRNPGVDNRMLAYRTNAGTALYVYHPTNGITGTEQIYTSHEPVFIKFCDFDFCGARTKGRSHKFFLHIDYTWKDRESWIPYLGLGAEIEWAPKPCEDICNDNYCNSCWGTGCCTPCGTLYGSYCGTCCTPCNTCNNCCSSDCSTCAVSQWGVWLKGGVAFN